MLEVVRKGGCLDREMNITVVPWSQHAGCEMGLDRTNHDLNADFITFL